MQNRETFGSRLGFILISAGCAIGLGNVWRFPYITGKYGGAAFILLYLAFLLLFGIPVMTMEFSVGRASRRSISRSFHELEPKGTKWHWWSFFGIAGNIILMMFYTTIAGWMFIYFYKYVAGSFSSMSAAEVGQAFEKMTGDPVVSTIAMGIAVVLGFAVCSLGVKEGVEAVNKKMMALLIVLMAVLAIRSITLDGAQAGLQYYLIPDFSKITENGVWNVMYQAMSQAFFTLSVGMGGMAIFGSYIGRERSLLGESINVAALDTFVALCSGLIVIPACFAFDVDPGSGPPLIFITLPSVFEQMPGGRFWGALFFLFMIFAAMSTVIGVMENIISCFTDLFPNLSRKKMCLIGTIGLFILSLPAVLGFNLWSDVQLLGGNILDFEDFLVSNNILPIGSCIYVLFCCLKNGWGWKNFMAEANSGKGRKFPNWARGYCTVVVPIAIVVILVMGYITKFAG
ncbi:sodium-dependent transporter [Butyricicoccus pullicaecorum]|uniref:Transporter n=1 Tax=Butyricicoccus pullicaecorum TaxID=501571 RepID=A0A1Y4LV89_9FIRM|nr:sodium-dependent transporter [Butyricicoccus pullicaecorum]OUP60544.1 sodium-dependent transporter [Butyricicoccus pullicaecorum]